MPDMYPVYLLNPTAATDLTPLDHHLPRCIPHSLPVGPVHRLHLRRRYPELRHGPGTQHLRSAFCEGHSRRLHNRVATTKAKAKAKNLNNAKFLWERACPRWQLCVPPDRTRCLHRGQARLPQGEDVGRRSCIQTGRPVAASTAFDLPAPSGGRTARHLKETQPTESTAFASPASEFRGCC